MVPPLRQGDGQFPHPAQPVRPRQEYGRRAAKHPTPGAIGRQLRSVAARCAH